jgi:hypothetical protein
LHDIWLSILRKHFSEKAQAVSELDKAVKWILKYDYERVLGEKKKASENGITIDDASAAMNAAIYDLQTSNEYSKYIQAKKVGLV